MKKISALFLLPSIFLACTNSGNGSGVTFSDTSDETGQQIGDSMASVDEAGGSGGSIAFNHSIEKTFQRLSPSDLKQPFWKDLFIEPAYANSCFSATTFGTCDSGTNSITRTFSDCRMGPATFNGTVNLTWFSSITNTDCHLHAIDDTITRIPDFSVTGLRGATLTVSQTGTVGQQLTWVSGDTDAKVFEFTNDGIRRTFSKSGSTLFDFTTKTTEAITVTGSDRGNRVMSGGNLQVKNNKNEVVCNYVPTDVTWSSSTCNCPVSGTWDGTCSNDKTTQLEITGCGTATFTVGDETGSVEFDRCEKI